MLSIQTNPYRVTGILAGSNEKEIQKQKSKINAYLNVGKEISFDTDFPIIGAINRNENLINDSFSKIVQNQGKVEHALFWFSNASHLDEPALNHLKDGDTSKAIDIWSKTIYGEVTSRNFSAFNNLGTLKLALAFSGGSLNNDLLRDAIGHKLRLLESDALTSFITHVADETYQPNSHEQVKTFIDALTNYLTPFINKPGGINISEVSNLFSLGSTNTKQYVASIYTSKHIHSVEAKIDKTKKARTKSPERGDTLGKKLFAETKEELATLKELLGVSNMQYQLLADKLAKEILQCGIDYFNAYFESDTIDSGPGAITLCRYAKSIAVGSQAKQRVEENTKNIQEWIDDKPERDRQKKIETDLVFITAKLKRFNDLPDSIENAKDLIVSCKPRLLNIKQVLGAYDKLYLQISSTIVGNAQGMLVSIVNRSQDKITSSYDPSSKYILLLAHSTVVEESLTVLNLLSSLDMTPEVRTRYNSNKQTLQSVKSQMDQVSKPRSKTSSGSGCYIATMAYGDYDHPQVIELRRFRDNVLSQSAAGRQFIKTYYHYSPKLVDRLQNSNTINKIIRTSLDQLIKIIK
ncbi:CFI-box-CTERM domain-containing protein [Pontibacter sp. MBLB2868]|uniref:CFI-box-CTERM domain-containing protein n=1 Tax=Pontibacter sp. MBLB2868 TaxID=3451555 RepID=UPI003F754D6A